MRVYNVLQQLQRWGISSSDFHCFTLSRTVFRLTNTYKLDKNEKCIQKYYNKKTNESGEHTCHGFT